MNDLLNKPNVEPDTEAIIALDILNSKEFNRDLKKAIYLETMSEDSLMKHNGPGSYCNKE